MKKFLIAFFLFQFIFIRAETLIDEVIVVGSYLKSTESDLSPINIINKDLIDDLNISSIAEISKYITKEVELNDEATVLRVLLNVNRPTGTNVDVYYKVLGAGSDDQMNEINWVEATPDDPIEINNAGQYGEVEYNVTPGDNFGSMMFKIVLRASNSAAVPTVKDFRVVAAT